MTDRLVRLGDGRVTSVDSITPMPAHKPESERGPCPSCYGNGTIYHSERKGPDTVVSWTTSCGQCGGSGRF